MTERVFNRMPRPLYRRAISLAEVGGGLAAAAALVLVVAWVWSQRDAFDPAERDVSFAVLEAQSVPDRLYRAPLKPWVEPGTAGGAPEVPLGAFPQGILDGPWQVGTRLQQFNPDNLYVKINGAAEQYLRYGFQQLHYISLRHASGPDELSIELYDQGAFANALGIFSTQRDPAKPVQREGASYFYETSVGAMGVLGRWFYRVAGNGETPAIREKSRGLVDALAALPVEQGEVPFGFRVLSEGLAVGFGEIAYQPRNVFQYDFATDFWFGRADAGPNARYFVHEAATPADAGELYERILAEHRYDYTLIDEGEERTVMRHRFLKSVFAMVLDGRYLYGVENGADEPALAPALRRMSEALARLGNKRGA